MHPMILLQFDYYFQSILRLIIFELVIFLIFYKGDDTLIFCFGDKGPVIVNVKEKKGPPTPKLKNGPPHP